MAQTRPWRRGLGSGQRSETEQINRQGTSVSKRATRKSGAVRMNGAVRVGAARVDDTASVEGALPSRSSESERYAASGHSPEFARGSLAVHPSHGVGRVEAIEERSFGGSPSIVYVLQILGSGLKVMVPKLTAARVGLRPVMDVEQADRVIAVLTEAGVAVDLQPYSRRFRAYTEMIASGDALAIARVLRDMHRLRADKELSFGERRLLDQARQLLTRELGIAKGLEPAQIEALIEGALSE